MEAEKPGEQPKSLKSKQKEQKPEAITLRDYCNRIGQEGNNKFAESFILGKLNERSEDNTPRTYEEWEAIHLEAFK